MKIRDFLNSYPKEDVKIVFSYLLNLNYGDIIKRLDDDLDEKLEEKAEGIFHKMKRGLPIQYAIGQWDFYGRTFLVDKRALIPRPETELLVETILNDGIKNKKILDIGTGSGAIAISLSLEDHSSEVWASDISKEALELACQNAKKLGANVEFIQSDLFENVVEKYDLVVSNPPYISEKDYLNLDEKLFFEPKMALLGGDMGYEIYEKIIDDLDRFLKPAGKVYFEIGYDQKDILFKLLANKGFKNIKCIRDYGQKDRIISATRP